MSRPSAPPASATTSADDLALYTAQLLTRSPASNLADIETLVRERYGIEGRAERLTGERDENFRLHTTDGPGYVLKVSPAGESAALTDLHVAVLLHLERVAPTIPVPRVFRTVDGKTRTQIVDALGASRSANLCTYIPGKLLSTSSARTTAQHRACGKMLARLATALVTFEHEACYRTIPWDLRQLPRLASLIPSVPDLPDVEFLRNYVADYNTRIAPRLAHLRHQFIHNDFNAHNIIVDPDDGSRIVGIIDFGDAVHTARIADVAVGVMGQLTTPESADEAIREFVDGYRAEQPLRTDEMGVLNWLIAGRIAQNVVITAWHRAQNPASQHFARYDAHFYGWRIDLARRLTFGSQPPA
jgi:Ser/Thr protein kinase RdoA (MazF antagonist)